jgi:carotenoid cleavage dioxygenase-like enzyme
MIPNNYWLKNNNDFSKSILLNKDSKMNQINGFFGIIGPDVSIPCKMNNLFDLFQKNGVLQGVFISNGSIQFVRHIIKTDKMKYEKENGEIPIHPLSLLLFELGNKYKMLPNIFGLANTALLEFQNKVFVLNERDLPYEININFVKKEIQTKEKLILGPNIDHFLAHSKIKRKNKESLIETLDYSIFSSEIKWFQFDEQWNLKKQMLLKKKYNSMIHDFISLENHMLFLDCSLKMEYNFKNKLSFHLSKDIKETSCIFIIEKSTGKSQKIDLGENCFLFHFGNSFETEKVIEFYGCFYDSFDFKTPEKNSGKFRKVIIDKQKSSVEIIKNADLENFSLDFPIIYKNYTILTHSFNSKNKNFVIVKNFVLKKVVELDNKYINGEASVIEIGSEPYLICFTYTENSLLNLVEHYLTIIGIENNETISILIPYNLTMGFHSIFLSP